MYRQLSLFSSLLSRQGCLGTPSRIPSIQGHLRDAGNCKRDVNRHGWMRSIRVVRASDCQCQCPEYDSSILRHGGAAGETVLKESIHKKNPKKIPLLDMAQILMTKWILLNNLCFPT
jgi:hypothetical protein